MTKVFPVSGPYMTAPLSAFSGFSPSPTFDLLFDGFFGSYANFNFLAGASGFYSSFFSGLAFRLRI
jgi:hypothetical protein